LSVRVI